MTTDDDELGALGLVNEMAGRMLNFDRRGLQSRPFHAVQGGHVGVAAPVQHDEINPRQDASPNAISIAGSDAHEPSPPTNTGRCANCGVDGISS